MDSKKFIHNEINDILKLISNADYADNDYDCYGCCGCCGEYSNLLDAIEYKLKEVLKKLPK